MSKSKPKIMDGAMGTMLLAHGISLNSCFEALNLTRPALIREIHRSYLEAGAEAVVANTFGANRPRLSAHQMGNRLERINRAGVTIAREAAGKKRAFASIGPLGPGAKKMPFVESFRFFREQAKALEKERPAGYVIETMTSLTQAEAATLAVREVSDRTVISLMTFPRGVGRAVGETVELISITLRSAGADVIGVNCGEGPEEAMTLIKAFSLVDPGPFCVRPSAGLPGNLPGNLMDPEAFAAWALKFQKMGCRWIGGCCGTTPAHIRAISESL